MRSVPKNPLENIIIIMESLALRTGVPAENGDQNRSPPKTLPRVETFEITLSFCVSVKRELCETTTSPFDTTTSNAAETSIRQNSRHENHLMLWFYNDLGLSQAKSHLN